MSEVPDRVRRAFAGHRGFEADTGETDEYVSTTTAFNARVTVDAVDGGRVRFSLELHLPTLSAVVDGDVADVVEEGWYETFELRVADAHGVTRGDHGLDPSVKQVADDIVVRFSYDEINETRGVDDAAALVTFVEGTYVQGVIPGYEYTDPVASLVSSAQEMGGF